MIFKYLSKLHELCVEYDLKYFSVTRSNSDNPQLLELNYSFII